MIRVGMVEGEPAKNPITLEGKPSGNSLKTNGHCGNWVYTSANTKKTIDIHPVFLLMVTMFSDIQHNN